MSAQAAVAAARAALLSEPRSDPSTTSASDDAAKARARAERLKAAADAEVGGAETVSETIGKVFAGYTCGTLNRGIEHPGDIAEAASLASIPLPPATYPLVDAIGDDVVDGGKLSKLQLEGVTYACQKHCEILPDGCRAGFMIGDGAGVGKGRQIGGIVLDNYARGRKKHLWLSSSADLHRDAERDLRDLGCYLRVINNCGELDKDKTPREKREGVLFLTYSTLVSRTSKRSRLDQIVEWFGGADADGCVLFDECHKAKNSGTSGDGGTKVAQCVIELQRRCPNARVVYLSATGISEIGNMAYMQRLGFWGVGTPFADADKFMSAMKNRGVGFLEMLAMEMKASGKYVSRGLSFRQAEFTNIEATLTTAQTRMYNDAAAFMTTLRACLTQALRECRADAGRVGAAKKAYWSAHQRFFKLLCVSIKVPTVVAEAKRALEEGKCVVIGLQTTGEAADAALELTPGARLSDFVSTTREMLRGFIRTHFPTHVVDVAAPGMRNQTSMNFDAMGGMNPWGGFDGYSLVAKYGGMLPNGMMMPSPGSTMLPNGMMPPPPPPPQPHPGYLLPPAPATPALREHAECVAARDALLERASRLDLPPNFLDELIDALGGKDAVAEMTGRRGRVVRASKKKRERDDGDGDGCENGGELTFELRGEARAASGRAAAGSIAGDGEVDGVNLKEKELFMSGAKLVAIISDAASTGISLHAREDAGNRRRRVHVTIELPWSADKAIQQLGRTHRSNQTSGPMYAMCSTNLGGEKRFAAAVARRLQSLGALTRGDRRAATGVDLREGDLDSPLGRRALKKTYDALLLIGTPLPTGVTLASVLAHLDPRAEADASEEERGLTADEIFELEKSRAGAGVAALHAELRALVVDLGVQVGLHPEGLDPERRLALEETSGGGAGGSSKDAGDVRRFLNRILGLPVRGQNLLFGYFTEVLEAEVKAAKAEGKYSEGVSDLSGSNIRIESTRTVLKDSGEGKNGGSSGGASGGKLLGGAELKRTRVLIDRGVSFDVALGILAANRRNPRDGFYRMRREMFGRAQIVLALAKVGAKNVFGIWRPNTGASFFEMDVDDLTQKYVKYDERDEASARAPWTATYELTEHKCMHGATCERGAGCTAGSRAVRCCILSGAVVPAWGVLERVLERHEHRFNKSDRGMRAVKVVAEDGTKVVGIRYPEDLIPEVKERIAQEWSSSIAMAAGGGGGGGGGTTAKREPPAGVISIDVPSPLSPNGARVRVEAPTPVSASCAARARRAPTTMHSFFQKRERDANDGSDVDGSGRGGDGGDAKPAPAAAKKAKGNALDNPLGFAPAASSASAAAATKPKPKPEGGSCGGGVGSNVCENCPICGFTFPRTALNTDVNAHMDACIANTVL